MVFHGLASQKAERNPASQQNLSIYQNATAKG